MIKILKLIFVHIMLAKTGFGAGQPLKLSCKFLFKPRRYCRLYTQNKKFGYSPVKVVGRRQEETADPRSGIPSFRGQVRWEQVEPGGVQMEFSTHYKVVHVTQFFLKSKMKNHKEVNRGGGPCCIWNIFVCGQVGSRFSSQKRWDLELLTRVWDAQTALRECKK